MDYSNDITSTLETFVFLTFLLKYVLPLITTVILFFIAMALYTIAGKVKELKEEINKLNTNLGNVFVKKS